MALDEIVALPIVFLGLGEPNAAAWVAGFVLFRVMDITKPPPVKWGERLPGGWGIVADDLLAAHVRGPGAAAALLPGPRSRRLGSIRLRPVRRTALRDTIASFPSEPASPETRYDRSLA